MSLEDHVAYSYPGSGCWMCNQPADIVAEVNRVRRGHRIGPDQVIKWLVAEKGYTRDSIRRGSIANHFSQGHHE